MTDYNYLLAYATDAEKPYLDAIIATTSLRDAAKTLGNINHQKLSRLLSRLKQTASLKGDSPDNNLTHAVPDPFIVKGYSTYYGQEGEVKGQWVKTKIDDVKRQEAILAAYNAMASDLPRVDAKPPVIASNDDLCNLAVFSDYHLGLLTHKTQFDDAWNIEIAESMLYASYEQMIKQLPESSKLVLCFQGDTLNTDALLPLTPAHHHVLQVDGSYHRTVTAAVRVMRRVIDCALCKFSEVHLIVAEGNHDESGSIWLRVMFNALYEHEPRLSVNMSELPFYAHQHGETMLGFHHGHKVKNEQLPLLFASQFSEMWGKTKKRYCHAGHRHHHDEKEYSGMSIMQHPTLVARDDYAARGGWISNRAAIGITYHKQYGQVARSIVCPEMFRS